jgi:UDP-2,3-diacylglucosamine pyrophosphatase LpxH
LANDLDKELEDKVKEFISEMEMDPEKEVQEDDNSLKKFDKLNAQSEAQMQSKEVQVLDFEPEGDKVQIVPISDIHLGSINSNIPKLRDFIKYIEETPNTYTVLTGDLGENATKTSIGLGVYEQRYDPQTQIEILEEELRPLAEKGKILGIQPGNHERRIMRSTSIDPMRILARSLGVPYLGYQGYLKLNVGEQTYHAITFHGRSGARTHGGKINAAHKMNRVANVDLYISGHTHVLDSSHDIIMEIDDETNEIVYRRRYYVIAGSFLSYWGGYPEMKAYSVADQGAMRIDLYKDRHKIKVHKP